MLSPSSNCCRIDAVKASANQLRLQATRRRAGGNDDVDRSVSQQLQSVDAQVRTGDANKAELALANARSALTKSAAQAQQHQRALASDEYRVEQSARYGAIDIRV